ncbi:hypothetical protein CDAR_512331 [Caerostris darwini]|uniref:Uncharacterized protein n=1 Tax=Caerostris darwini TaxID=1538125 RepID=A0AAV4WGL6_9ARAC|nr:hypothetical protein CDAR_512331 [Caerostris darwini]
MARARPLPSNGRLKKTYPSENTFWGGGNFQNFAVFPKSYHIATPNHSSATTSGRTRLLSPDGERGDGARFISLNDPRPSPHPL